MHLLPYFIIFIFLLLLLKNRVWGFSFYFACRIILPPIVRLGPLSMNSVMAIILLACILLLDRNKKIVKRKTLINLVLVLIIPLGIIGLLGHIPYSFQLNSLLQFFLTELSPFLSLVYIVRTKDDLRQILLVMFCSYICVGIWGVITYMLKMNPLYTYFMLTYAGDYEVADFTGDGFDNIRGALSATATGNLSGPLPWGQESMLIALFILFYKDNINIPRVLFISVLALAIVNTFLTGKRSCLLPLILALIYYLWKKKFFSVRNISLLILGALSVYIVISYIPSLEGLSKNIESTIFFWDDSMAQRNGIAGSNMEMRQSQFECAHQMVGNNILWGLGYDYPSFYSSKFGAHPIMHGFESIYFNVLVSSGVLGLLIWFLFFRKMIRITYNNGKNRGFLFAYHGGFILSCILTSIQSSMWIYMILSILYIKSNLLSNDSFNNNSGLQCRKIH